jgi:hypothetical protein
MRDALKSLILDMKLIFPRKTQKARTDTAVFDFLESPLILTAYFSCVSCISWTIKAVCITSENNQCYALYTENTNRSYESYSEVC